jgi:hypothetical protein
VWLDQLKADLYARYPRIVPFGSRIGANVIQPNATISVAHGGAFQGHITWVENLYIAYSQLQGHLWGFASEVAMPLLDMHWRNSSSAMGGYGHARAGAGAAGMGGSPLGKLGLPPIDNLVVLGMFAHEKLDREHPFNHNEYWASGFLDAILQYMNNGSYSAHLKRRGYHSYPYLEPYLKLNDNATLKSASSPYLIPYTAQIMRNTVPGTRLIFDHNDFVPLPLIPGARTKPPVPDADRLCARRAVLLGYKPNVVGGHADAQAIRTFSRKYLGVTKHHQACCCG